MTRDAKWDEAYSLYSDLYKDRYGFRPRGQHLLELSADELYALVDKLPPFEDIEDNWRPWEPKDDEGLVLDLDAPVEDPMEGYAPDSSPLTHNPFSVLGG